MNIFSAVRGRSRPESILLVKNGFFHGECPIERKRSRRKEGAVGVGSLKTCGTSGYKGGGTSAANLKKEKKDRGRPQ